MAIVTLTAARLVRLEQFGFLSRTWIRHEGRDELEETRMPPRGDLLGDIQFHASPVSHLGNLRTTIA
jgi:hypothetical protein